MFNLLSANFIKIRRSIPFYLCIAFMVIASCGIAKDSYSTFYDNMIYTEFHGVHIDDDITDGIVLFIPLSVAVFSALFLSKDNSEKTIRNKITVGCKRENVYLADLITVFLVSLIFLFVLVAVLFIAYFVTLILSKGSCELYISDARIFIKLVMAILTMFSFSSLCVFIVKSIRNKAVAVTLVLIVTFVIYFVALSLDLELRASWNEAENSWENNLSETKEILYIHLLDFLPLYDVSDETSIARKSLYSLILSAVSTFVGVRLFQKKNIK